MSNSALEYGTVLFVTYSPHSLNTENIYGYSKGVGTVHKSFCPPNAASQSLFSLAYSRLLVETRVYFFPPQPESIICQAAGAHTIDGSVGVWNAFRNGYSNHTH